MVLLPTAAATRVFTMVSFTEAVSRRNSFVRGTCAPPSALLVLSYLNTDAVCLYFMLQNALRAVVERHSESTELPKIKILICKGREDVIIKVTVVSYC